MNGDNDSPFAFAPAPFKPEEALLRLQRDLRGLGLSEREGAFERRGLKIARASIADGQLTAAIAKLPARAPDWQSRNLGSSADLRDFVADLKKRMTSWNDRDD